MDEDTSPRSLLAGRVGGVVPPEGTDWATAGFGPGTRRAGGESFVKIHRYAIAWLARLLDGAYSWHEGASTLQFLLQRMHGANTLASHEAPCCCVWSLEVLLSVLGAHIVRSYDDTTY